MTDNKKRIYNPGPRGKGHPIEDYTTLGSPYKDLTIVKSEQMAEMLDKLNNIEKNLDLLLSLMRRMLIQKRNDESAGILDAIQETNKMIDEKRKEDLSLEDRAKALGFDVDNSGNILMLGKVVCTEPVRSVFIYGAECMNKRLSLERFAENLDLEITDENLQMANDILEQKIAARKQKG